MRFRKRSVQAHDNGQDFWPSVTDMMATVALVMLLMAMIAFIHIIFETIQQEHVRDEVAQVANVKEEVSTIIERELEAAIGQDQVVRGPNNTISIEGDILFDTGSAQISEQGERILRPLADAFQHLIEREDMEEFLYIILIEGHTDRVPYDNWTLSTERSVAVVKYLLEANPVLSDPDYARYFAATGYSEYHPIADGMDDESLAQNRRISFQIVLDDEKWQEHLLRLLPVEDNI